MGQSLISKLLFLIFPLSVIIDLVNGYTQVQLGLHTPIGQIYRIIIMGLSTYCILKNFNKTIILYLSILVFYYLLSYPIWLVDLGLDASSGFNLSIEVENTIKCIYFFLIISFFISYKEIIVKLNPLNIITNYGLLISFSIIFSFITGFGNNSMGEDYGFGTKSYFKAGNDLGITLLYCGVISSIYLIKKFTYLNLIKTFSILASGMLVGSRVAMVGSFFWIIISIVYITFGLKQNDKKYKNTLLIYKIIIGPTLILAIVYLVIFIISMFDNYMINKFSLEGIQRARTSLTDIANIYISNMNVFRICFGAGMSSLYYFVGVRYPGPVSDGMYRAVEADFHELIGGYGILGLIVIVTPFIYFALKACKLQLKKPSFVNFSILFILVSFIFIAFLGGHCFRNAMVAPIYGFISSLLYKRDEYIISK